MLIWLYLLHVQPRLPALSPPCLSARWMESSGSQRWQNATQTCLTYCDSAPLQILVRIKKPRKKQTNIRIKNYSKQFCFNSLLRYCVALFQSHFQETFLCNVLLPTPSSLSPTQPSKASSWQPLHTPRLTVSSRCRKRSNSALALEL